MKFESTKLGVVQDNIRKLTILCILFDERLSEVKLAFRRFSDLH